MEYKHTKEELLDIFFGVNSNAEIEDDIDIRKKLEEYKQHNGYDIQIEDTLLLSKMSQLESKFDNFEKATELLKPIIARANDQDDLDLIDIRIMTVAVGHTKDFRQSCYIASKLLKNLKKYKDHPRCPRIKMSIHSNVSYKSLRAKYFEDLENSYEYLKKEFLIHIDAAIELCKKNKFNDMIGINYIRKGLFLLEFDLIDKGLNLIKKTGNSAIYDMAMNDINEYEKYIKFYTTGDHLKSTIAENFKKYRNFRNMSLKEVSELTNISAGYLSSVENNNKVPSIHSLVKIAEALNVSLELLVNDKEKIPFVAENSLKLDEATSMLMKMNPLELNFTLDSMRNLLKFRKG